MWWRSGGVDINDQLDSWTERSADMWLQRSPGEVDDVTGVAGRATRQGWSPAGMKERRPSVECLSKQISKAKTTYITTSKVKTSQTNRSVPYITMASRQKPTCSPVQGQHLEFQPRCSYQGIRICNHGED
jgi:hypothetical protein